MSSNRNFKRITKLKEIINNSIRKNEEKINKIETKDIVINSNTLEGTERELRFKNSMKKKEMDKIRDKNEILKSNKKRLNRELVKEEKTAVDEAENKELIDDVRTVIKKFL